MNYFVIIRGPAAVGKSVVSKIVAEKLGALCISFDDILRKNTLDKIEGDGISAENFVKGNEIALSIIKKSKPEVVVLDGCFYRDEQFNHLLKNIKGKHFIFTLKAKVDECLSRNQRRGSPLHPNAIKDVFKLVSKKDYGTTINTSGKNVNQVAQEILDNIPIKMNQKIMAIIYSEKGNFLLLRTNPKWMKCDVWFIVTGSVNKGESKEDAVRREVFEETRLKIAEIRPTNYTCTYECPKKSGKWHEEKAFLVKVKEDVPKLSGEHTEFKWLSKEKFIKQIDWWGGKEKLRGLIRVFKFK